MMFKRERERIPLEESLLSPLSTKLINASYGIEPQNRILLPLAMHKKYLMLGHYV